MNPVLENLLMEYIIKKAEELIKEKEAEIKKGAANSPN